MSNWWLASSQGGFKLPEVFGKFGFPSHQLARVLRMLEGQSFGVQGLAGESDEPAALSVFAIFWMVSAIANQG